VNEVELVSSAWFGDNVFRIDFPSSWEVVVVGNDCYPAMTDEELKNAILHPIGSPPLSKLALGKNRAALLVDDITRPTPSASLLPHVIEELRMAGIPDESIIIIIAGGTHQPATPEDILKITGNISSSIKIYGHDCKQNLNYLGQSSRGTPIYANEEVLKCDLKVGIGAIFPHSSAGFSGGSKIIMPGVCGLATASYAHHKLKQGKGRGDLSRTEFRKEIEEIAQTVGLDFIVNVVLNQRRQVTALFAGDRILAHQKGAEFALKLYSAQLVEDADIIITDAYPFDISFFFATSRSMWAVSGANHGTATIAIAACSKGIGYHELFSLARPPLKKRVMNKLRNLQMRDLFHPFEQIKKVTRHFRSKTEIRRTSGELMVLSQGITSEDLSSIFPDAKLYQSWEELLRVLQNRFKDSPVKVVVYRCAPLLIPTYPGSEKAS
jgi:nickel-dependent lactate racemase